MGDEAEDILAASTIDVVEKKLYEPVKKIFEDHLVGKRNKIYELVKFHRRRHEPGESVDSFVTALHALIETCEYAALKDELIRDRFIVGLAAAKLSETLQLDSTLTLETAVAKARLCEVVHMQQSFLRVDEGKAPEGLDEISKHCNFSGLVRGN